MQFASIQILLFMAFLLSPNANNGVTKSAPTGIELESPEVSTDSLTLNQLEGIIYQESTPFTGISVSYFSNNLVAEKITYLNGQREGLRQKWFPSGELSYEANYQSNKVDGIVKTWWYNGNLRSTSSFVEGKPHGTQKQWYVSGQIFKEQNLTFGKEEGLQKAWRKNGKIYANYEAKNGRIFGLKRSNLCYELNDENIVYDD